MFIRPIVLLAAALLASVTTEAQQSPSTPPAQVQAKPAPCTPKSIMPKWFHPEKIPAIRDVITQIQKSSGGAIDSAEVVQGVLKPTPCPTNPGTTAKVNQTPPPRLAAPPVAPVAAPYILDMPSEKPLEGDTSVIACSPAYPQGKGLPFFFPGREDYAVPAQPNTPEFVKWFPDYDSKTLCSSLKYDTATHKYFVQK